MSAAISMAGLREAGRKPALPALCSSPGKLMPLAGGGGAPGRIIQGSGLGDFPASAILAPRSSMRPSVSMGLPSRCAYGLSRRPPLGLTALTFLPATDLSV